MFINSVSNSVYGAAVSLSLSTSDVDSPSYLIFLSVLFSRFLPPYLDPPRDSTLYIYIYIYTHTHTHTYTPLSSSTYLILLLYFCFHFSTRHLFRFYTTASKYDGFTLPLLFCSIFLLYVRVFSFSFLPSLRSFLQSDFTIVQFRSERNSSAIPSLSLSLSQLSPVSRD